MTTIYFDMDGTLANFYGVEGWLDYIHSLARILNRLQKAGFRIGIISWLARNSNPDYDEVVTKAKMDWLKKHLASVHFDEIHIKAYGTPKHMFATENDILFDDELPNREAWGGEAFHPAEMMKILSSLQA